MAWAVLACTVITAPLCYGAQQYRLGLLHITGNARTDELIVRRMIPINEGDIFNLVKWEQGLEQISRSGLFEPVTPADVTLTFDEKNGIVNAELRLKERDHQRIDVSAGGGTTGGFAAGHRLREYKPDGRRRPTVGPPARGQPRTQRRRAVFCRAVVEEPCEN